MNAAMASGSRGSLQKSLHWSRYNDGWSLQVVEKSGAPGESRTPDLLVRSQTLYPAELRARRSSNTVKIDYDTPP
jgi:hypothetical protein